MTLRKLASQLCKLEGKKSQVKMGDMMETLKLLTSLIAAEYVLFHKDFKLDDIKWAGSPSFDFLNTEIDKKIDKYYKKQTKQKRKK